MKVYTKTGDSGETSLFGGKRVPKFDARIEAYGTVDELNAWIGLIRDQEIYQGHITMLLEVQDRLFTLGSILAADPDKPKLKKPDLYESDIHALESAMDSMEEGLEPMKHFVLPGGHTIVSYCHVARCVCRRAERLSVLLSETESIPPVVIQYLNRLSDYLFVLSRKLSVELSATEIPWRPRL